MNRFAFSKSLAKLKRSRSGFRKPRSQQRGPSWTRTGYRASWHGDWGRVEEAIQGKMN